jgi:hypothetical protein
LLAAGPGRAQDANKPKPDPTKPEDYHPIAVGTVWQYKTENGTFTKKVVSHERIDGVNCARIEFSFAGQPACFEHIGVKSDGIYRYSYNGVRSDKPVCLLKLPPKKGDTWPVEVKASGETLKGTFKVDEEEIKVPAGTYKTFASALKQDSEKSATPAVGCTYYFAAGVGIVKQEIKVGNQLTTVELEKFEPKVAGK